MGNDERQVWGRPLFRERGKNFSSKKVFGKSPFFWWERVKRMGNCYLVSTTDRLSTVHTTSVQRFHFSLSCLPLDQEISIPSFPSYPQIHTRFGQLLCVFSCFFSFSPTWGERGKHNCSFLGYSYFLALGIKQEDIF